jgi:putative N-acetyltransferase (TIGR04045 family)
MLSELPTLYRPAAFMVNQVTSSWEQQAALALRRAVFCVEQGIFMKDDRDLLDDCAITLVALSCVAGQVDDVVGTVRLHPGSDPATSADSERKSPSPEEVYWGSRLAVHPGARGAGQIGTSLIRRAVRTAVTLGATRFFAHVQLQNVPMFEALHWRSLDTVVLHGRRHALMQADLLHYPPLPDTTAAELIFAKARG